MSIQRIGIVLLVLLGFSSGVGAEEGAAQPTPAQFFLKANEEGTCDQQIIVDVFALDSYGLILKDYQGAQTPEIEVKEIGGRLEKSARATPEELNFKNGKATFYISDAEPEALELSLRIQESVSPFPLRITIKERIIPERLVIQAAARASIHEPLTVRVASVDRKGDVAGDYSGTVRVEAEELGTQQKSSSVLPDTIALVDGTGACSISDTEEEGLIVRAVDANGKLSPGELQIVFARPDATPPEITEVKMETLAFIELTFSEELDDVAATDANNYEIICAGSQRPRSVEFHGNRVIIELNDLLRPHDTMYVVVKNIKDVSGNVVPSGTRSPDYAVPYVPLRLELIPSSHLSPVNSPITVNLTVRCISGRVAQFVNGKFSAALSEDTPNGSASVSSAAIQMNKGSGQVQVNDLQAEKVRLTVSDPENAVSQSTVELEFS